MTNSRIIYLLISFLFVFLFTTAQENELKDQLSDKRQRKEALIQLAKNLHQKQEYQKSNEYIHLLMDENLSIEERFNLKELLGINLIRQSKYDSALVIYTELFDKTANDIQQIKYQLQIAEINRTANNYDDAEKEYNKAIEIINLKGQTQFISEAYNLMGSMYWQKGDLDLAVKIYKLALEKMSNDSIDLKIKVLNNIALCYKDQSNYTEAFQLHYQSIQLAKQSGNLQLVADSYHHLANSFYRQNSLDSAINYYNKAYRLRLDLNDSSSVFSSLINLANTYQKMSLYDTALVLNIKALLIAEQLNNKFSQISALNNLGIINKDIGNYSDAAIYFYKGLSVAHQIDNNEILAQTYNRIAQLYIDLNNFPKALEFLKEAVNYAQEVGNKLPLAYRLHQLGNLYYNNGDFTAAQIYYSNALNLREEMKDENSFAQSLNAMGNSYREQGSYDKALLYYNKAYEINKKLNNQTQVAYNLNNIGNIYAQQDNTKSAVEYFLQSYNLAKEVNNQFISSLTARKLGELYRKNKSYNLAEQYLNESYDIGSQINHMLLKQKALEELYELYYSQGNYKKALDYFRLSSEIEQESIIEANNRKIFETQLNYELDQKSDTIQQIESQLILSRQNEKIKSIEADKYKTQRSLLFVIFLLVITASVLVYYFLVQLRSKNKELDKAYQNATQANLQLKKSENLLKELNQTKDKFFSIIAHDLRSPISGLMNFTKILDEQGDEITADEFRDANHSIYNSAKQLYSLLENLLEWSRSQTGKIKFIPEKINLKLLVDDVTSLLKVVADKKSIELKNSIPANTEVLADTNMVKTIIRNLLSNAIKFTPEKGTVSILCNEENNIQKITIADTGMGMDEETKNKLFKIDQQISRPGTNNESGTGLGLILCHEFVSKNNGTITVESEEGKGTEISFTLPKS